MNQTDQHERSYQAGFMRDICQSAKVVLACLGEDPSNGRCIRIAERLEVWSALSVELDDMKVLIEGLISADFRDEQLQLDWSALHDLLDYQWWQRGWVTRMLSSRVRFI
ncbi:hypothetical protein PSPO01_01475 [Paraphaeosphaeria sporulosa]